jgi:hypothetical protein
MVWHTACPELVEEPVLSEVEGRPRVCSGPTTNENGAPFAAPLTCSFLFLTSYF